MVFRDQPCSSSDVPQHHPATIATARAGDWRPIIQPAVRAIFNHQPSKVPAEAKAAELHYTKNYQAGFIQTDGIALDTKLHVDSDASSSTVAANTGVSKPASAVDFTRYDRYTVDKLKDPADPAAKGLPESIEVRKANTTYRINDTLRVARRALARNDQDGARAARRIADGWNGNPRCSPPTR